MKEVDLGRTPDIRNSEMKEGWVYLIRAENTPRYKIGRTIDPIRRYKQLKRQSPYPLKIIDLFWTPDMVGDEEFLHIMFIKYKKHGEWYEFNLGEKGFKETQKISDFYSLELLFTQQLSEKGCVFYSMNSLTQTRSICDYLNSYVREIKSKYWNKSWNKSSDRYFLNYDFDFFSNKTARKIQSLLLNCKNNDEYSFIIQNVCTSILNFQMRELSTIFCKLYEPIHYEHVIIINERIFSKLQGVKLIYEYNFNSTKKTFIQACN